MERDYSQAEINNMIEELTTIHIAKLKHEETAFLANLVIQHEVSQSDRDTLIRMYEGMGEAGYD